jgi:DNA mismatch repair protein MutL
LSPRVPPAAPVFSYEPNVWKHPPYTVREEAAVYGKKDVEGFTAARDALSRDTALTALSDEDAPSAETVWPIGQIDKLYIAAQSEQSLYIIDQHAAHERILFDRLSAGKKDVPAQEFLLPFYIELPSDEVDLVLAYREIFVELGFDLEAAGPDAVRLLAAPADLASEELPAFMREALRSLLEMKNPAPADLRKDLIALASCRAAVKAGQTLNMREMRELLNQLMKTDNPFTCPHGRPVIVKYDARDLAALFKRT